MIGGKRALVVYDQKKNIAEHVASDPMGFDIDKNTLYFSQEDVNAYEFMH
ncbi:MAG: hypothetical protein R3A45_12105 [Bdellovibrionota bacterium]